MSSRAGRSSGRKTPAPSLPTFIDLFAGCGGLSLGLLKAGWHGLFAIEQNADAFKTFRHNLVDPEDHAELAAGFDWPEWLPREPMDIRAFLDQYRDPLSSLRGKVTLVAGGPPCQGFSFAGQRQANDPRNQLFASHLEIVDILRPPLVLLENVQGIKITHGRTEWLKNGRRGRLGPSYAEKIKGLLEEHGYVVEQDVVRACDFGVPQLRPRFLTIGIRKDLLKTRSLSQGFFEVMHESRRGFLESLGLPADRHVTVKQAISDLLTEGKKLVACDDRESPKGFKQLASVIPRSSYQRLMHGSQNGRPVNSLRLVNHLPSTVKRFKKILKCRKGVQLSAIDRERLGIKKNCLVPLCGDKPSHTLTTLPDDLLHYREPRVHTVRECARLQSFPDWFNFLGKFTTGGDRRKRECPRYSQVGNAVPPLLAQATGVALRRLVADLDR